MLRLPPGMRDQIAEAARRNGRSMNAEIVWRLEISMSFSAFAMDEAEAKLTSETSLAAELRYLGERLLRAAEKADSEFDEPQADP